MVHVGRLGAGGRAGPTDRIRIWCGPSPNADSEPNADEDTNGVADTNRHFGADAYILAVSACYKHRASPANTHEVSDRDAYLDAATHAGAVLG